MGDHHLCQSVAWTGRKKGKGTGLGGSTDRISRGLFYVGRSPGNHPFFRWCNVVARCLSRMNGETSLLSTCCIATMARHKLHASRGCTGSAYEDMKFIARSWLCATVNKSINIQLGRKDTSNEPLYLADVSKASISIGEDDFVSLCGRVPTESPLAHCRYFREPFMGSPQWTSHENGTRRRQFSSDCRQCLQSKTGAAPGRTCSVRAEEYSFARGGADGGEEGVNVGQNTDGCVVPFQYPESEHTSVKIPSFTNIQGFHRISSRMKDDNEEEIER
ncbi:hypothetical protein EDD85DRAFT_1003714 [Armillaria nabsnona]|nr:hypothetical protein EDD85DRAFT_1003714 [Armillaria nabsnona]